MTIELSKFKEVFRRHGINREQAATLLLRAQLILELKNEFQKKGWTQTQAAAELGVKQPRIAEIVSLRIDRFSVELLIRYLSRIKKEVSLKVDDVKVASDPALK